MAVDNVSLTCRRYGNKSETNLNSPDRALQISTNTILLKYLLHWLGCPTCGGEILFSFWTFLQLCTLNCMERQIINSLLVSVSARLAAAGIIACEAGNERLIFRVWAEFREGKK